ncbi:rRNA processing protein Rrp16 [Schizosaccharomyces cryophilus OY26]|uniref:Ribosome biogenesis protein NOP53 n=1 Tax=Schizosaccharomyces cryophilus (strain OY26 / ATCC MYA-4695 / CBS 11777 / NBRC 106824 / NRRL Y48691) TaxID=653667 RepID=S9VWP2_SCHCR|nr:rRNA processing protein Rrp16 [Schizosaccharomyces cryophilus OY26]EPY50355.1 rRNA processing protein Rrp16 [Schizosaccharomyces cryophilus OY26]
MGIQGNAAPSQYNQRSRKNKKSWRKHIDLEDVEGGLQAAGEEEIRGDNLAKKSNDALFVVDTLGDDRVAKRSRKKIKPLKVDEILQNKSAIGELSSKPKSNGFGLSMDNKGKVMSKNELNRLKSLVHRNPLGPTASAAAASLKSQEKEPIEYDVWESTAESTIPVKRPSSLSKAPENLADNAELVPNVEVADPGMSYNPDANAWMGLIDRKGSGEIKKEKERLHEIEVQKMISLKMNEDKGLISDENERSGDEENTTEAEKQIETHGKVEPKRKTKSQRNKERKRKEELAKLEAAKKQEQLLKMVDKAPSISKTLNNKEENEEKSLVDSNNSGTTEIRLKKRKFGKHKLPENPLELKLGDELTSSLRELKPEGNLFKDRFISLQRRAIIPPSVPASKRARYGTKLKEKYSHKDFHLQKTGI